MNNYGTIYDDVFRTIQERHPELLIPLMNEAFHTNYSEKQKIKRLPEEYRKILSNVVADSCFLIGKHIYHMECQSTTDNKMILRMIEYDFTIGLSQAEYENGIWRIRFPHPCIFYLRHNHNTPDPEELEIIFADGQMLRYRVPVIKAQVYSLEVLFQKKLYICLPYYIMRYEKKFHEISHDPEKSEKLLTEYKQMLELLEVKMQHDENGLFQDLLRLIRKVAEFQLRNETELQERMCNIMGGKVLPLPSDALREAESKGASNGELRVNKLILALQSQGRTEEIITAASDREYQKKLFEEFGI